MMTNILSEYVYENNFFKKNKKSLKIFLNLCRNNNLLKKNNVCLKHRVLYKPKRRSDRHFSFILPINTQQNRNYESNNNHASRFNFSEGIDINNFVFTANSSCEI